MITIPGYRIEGELGKGGQARVYLATQESMQRRVAIKVLLDEYANDDEFAERFLREARTVANLSHPGIVPVYDFGQAEGTYFMVMEHLPGGDLKDRLGGELPANEALSITAQLAEALHFAHQKGYVHRDVKPGNIMFREDGSAVLTDFGIARLQSGANQMTMVGQVLGTPKFMSPEQLRDRQLDGRSDLYSLGILFHLMLTGRVPYDHEDFMTLAMMHCKEAIPRLGGSARKYQNLFERMVAKEPDKRFAHGQELANTVRDILHGRIEPSRVDSASAAELKRTARFQPVDVEEEGSIPKQPLSWETSVALQDMDPVVNRNWYRKAVEILKGLDRDKRRYVLAHHLQPKGIYIDRKSRKLVFAGRPGVDEVKRDIASPRLQQIAGRLQQAEEMLETTRDAAAFADIMESSLGRIDKFDANGDLAIQRDKMALRQAFLDDLANVTRGARLEVPQNRRGITEETVKTFIIEVFLKHQMYGYRFKNYPTTALESDGNDFLRDRVAREARTRQCDLVHTDRYLFMIAPVNHLAQNPYSARRFIHEESMMNGEVVYFNGVAIPFASLDKPGVRKHIAWSMTRIVTLERRLSTGLSELVREMEDVRCKQLIPMLQQDLASDGTRLEDSIAHLLDDCEEQMSSQIMAKLPRALSEMACTEDDFEYLFHTWRSLLIQLGCDIRDFTSQFAATFSETADELDKKVMSYLALLDKRKDAVFRPRGASETDPDQDPQNLIREFIQVLDHYEPEVNRLQRKQREATHRAQEPTGRFQAWLDRIIGREKRRESPESVENEILNVRKQALLDLIRVCKHYSHTTVFLEFEGLQEVYDNVRHYALPAGPLGLGELPRIISLHEDPADFDFSEVRQKINARGQHAHPFSEQTSAA